MNDDGEEYSLALTNQALYYNKMDGYDVQESMRIPLCQISQVVYHKGSWMDDKYMEIFREGATDRFDEDKRLALWELAINERFDSATADHDYKYYSKINIKDLNK